MIVIAPVMNDDYVGMHPAERPPGLVENGRSLLSNTEAATRCVL